MTVRRPARIVAVLATVGGAAATLAVMADGGGRSVPEPDFSAAAPASAARTTFARNPRALRLLARAAHAERRLSYAGTEYVSAWQGGTTASYVVDLTHRPGIGTTVHLHSDHGDVAKEIFESDAAGPSVVAGSLAVPGLDTGPLDLLSANYGLSVGRSSPRGTEVVATRPGGVVAARMWIDPANGLLVRREIYDQTGRLVRASAFVDLEVGSVSMPAVAASPAPTASGTVLTSASLTQLRAQGWVTPDLLPDEMVLYDARTTDTAGHHILHLSYSNGLSTLSLFVERGRLDANHLTGWQRMSMGGSVYVREDGLSERVVWGGGGMVYTVVGDAPLTDIASVVARLPHHEAHRGTMARLGHGLSRLGSWINPFG